MSALIQSPADLFYFGPSDRRLLGAFHGAQTYAHRESGVVICYPFGHEYIRSHRACLHLATRLARVGFPVLRFDYSGTGDSAGDAEDVSLEYWRDDMRLAVQHLKDRSGVESICLAGLRLGATLASQVAAEDEGVTALILWEPIVNGGGYLSELAEAHRDLLWRFFDNAPSFATHSSSEYLGFPMRKDLRAELERIDLLTDPPPQADRVLLVENESSSEIEQLRDRLCGLGIETYYQQIPSFSTWREDVDKGLVPDNVLRGIVSWAEEELN